MSCEVPATTLPTSGALTGTSKIIVVDPSLATADQVALATPAQVCAAEAAIRASADAGLQTQIDGMKVMVPVLNSAARLTVNQPSGQPWAASDGAEQLDNGTRWYLSALPATTSGNWLPLPNVSGLTAVQDNNANFTAVAGTLHEVTTGISSINVAFTSGTIIGQQIAIVKVDSAAGSIVSTVGPILFSQGDSVLLSWDGTVWKLIASNFLKISIVNVIGGVSTGTYRTTAATIQKATGTINGAVQSDGTVTGNYTFTFTSAIPVANVVVRVDGFDMDQTGDVSSITTDGTTITVVLATGNAPANDIVLKNSSVTL